MTPLLQRLGIPLPIVQGPMTGSDTPPLAAAVSQAGGLGMLGCGMRSPEAMAQAAAAVRAATDRPFGMNLFVLDTPAPDAATVQAAMARLAPLYAEFGLTPEAPARWCEDFAAQFEALVAARPAVASFTFGILDGAQVERLHGAGCVVVGTATTLAEALAWQDVGADAVCASGMEAGGHRGTFLGDVDASLVGTMALIPQCVDALRIPVIAAGGIMDGRGIAAAQALGAQAVQMGTAFLACPESGITPAQRAAMARAQGTDTRITRAYSGRPARGIVNTMMERLAADEAAIPPYPIQNALTGALRRAAGVQGRADYLSLWAGQGVGAARVMPAGELVALLAQEWRAATARARE
jgi:nitronate monooxygenase